ncbi:MAG TPA: nicotinate-nucleotide--dimethylbenzimidazole phosphoribosyltransferase [bacterium]|jgi:nicotinate-nucleotide--dimethylbenzimidazole phosphoribosyltransferase|nr:nicotinate-nucleotide--dimethylbenzimidazole phosphoribosyltransferase [bacterium]
MASTIPALSSTAASEVQSRLDRKTKPTGSLGRLEELAVSLAAMSGKVDGVFARKVVLVAAGDHGVARQGVSLYPPEVTPQMVLNFLSGGAAINVLARRAGARVVVADAGVNSEALPKHPGLLNFSAGRGTADFSQGPAMSKALAQTCVDNGRAALRILAAEGLDLLALGEMGIGNTSASSALCACLLGLDVEAVTGRGTGLDAEARQRKVEVLRKALKLNAPDPADPLDCLAKVGGFEIGLLAGAMLEAASHRIPVVLDGFITGAAALVACRMDPALKGFLLASHQGREPGHRLVLEHLGLRAYLNLDLRLGEGSGAALFLPLVDVTHSLLAEMATFESAGVSDKA